MLLEHLGDPRIDPVRGVVLGVEERLQHHADQRELRVLALGRRHHDG